MTRQLAELACKQAGINLFTEMDDNERMMLRFGMLPAGKVKTAEKAFYAANPDILETLRTTDVARLMAVGAMDACNASGKRMVV